MGFFGVGDGGFFEEDVLSCFEGGKGVGVVVAVWEGVVDAINGWVGNEVWGSVS